MPVSILIHLQEKARIFLRSVLNLHTVGIVCEYNPFHNGHLYQLQETRRLLGADTVTVCVMSGDFVQRGEAAVFDKFARAEAACRCGADLVVELPLPWCLSSAEGFAFGSVSLLSALGCDTLSFGSESADTLALRSLAAFLSGKEAQDRIHALMDADETLSFARARQLAAAEALGDAAALLSNPNDILAVEYLKAIAKTGAGWSLLQSAARAPLTTAKRKGSTPPPCSLRECCAGGEDISAISRKPAMAVFTARMQAGRSATGRAARNRAAVAPVPARPGGLRRPAGRGRRRRPSAVPRPVAVWED